MTNHKSQTHNGRIKIACGLQVVAGEDAEATREQWQRFVETELHTEVRDARERR